MNEDETGSEQGNSELEQNRKLVASYFKDETDFPDKTIDALLAGIAQPVDTSVLTYRGNDRLPKNGKEADSGLVLVHLTNYKPEDGCVIPTYEATVKPKAIGKSEVVGDESEDGNQPPNKYFRMTVHTSVNSSVPIHALGNWEQCRYIVFAPLSDNSDRIAGFALDDTYVLGPLYLGDGSKVIELGDGEDESDYDRRQVLREMMGTGIIDRHTIQQMLYDAVDRDNHIETIAAEIVNEDLTVNTAALRARLPDDSKYASLLEGIDELKISRFLDSPTQYVVIKELLAMGKLPFFAEVDPKDPKKYFKDSRSQLPATPTWTNSGLYRFQARRFNRASRDDNEGRGHYHAASVWHDLEKVYSLCTRGGDSSVQLSDITQELAGVPDQFERIKTGVSLIKPGGKLWIEVLKDTWRSPRSFLYARKVLVRMRKELEAELSKLK